MKGCLKSPSPADTPPSHSPSSSTPGTPLHGVCSALPGTPNRHVVFCAADPEIHFADEWDRTPVEAARKLSYQEILELKAIQRSLPHASQPIDPLSRRPLHNQFLCKVPVGLLPLLSESDNSTTRPPSTPTGTESPPPTPTSFNHSSFAGVGVQNAFASGYHGNANGFNGYGSALTNNTKCLKSNLPPPFRPPPNPTKGWDDDEHEDDDHARRPWKVSPALPPRSGSSSPSFPFPRPVAGAATPPSPLVPSPRARPKNAFAFLALLESPVSSEPSTPVPSSPALTPLHSRESSSNDDENDDVVSTPEVMLTAASPVAASPLSTYMSSPLNAFVSSDANAEVHSPDLLPSFKRRTPSTTTSPPAYFPRFPVAVSASSSVPCPVSSSSPPRQQQGSPPRQFTLDAAPVRGRKEKVQQKKRKVTHTELMMINDELVEVEVEASDMSGCESDASSSSVVPKVQRKKKIEYMMINDEVVAIELDEYESDEEEKEKGKEEAAVISDKEEIAPVLIEGGSTTPIPLPVSSTSTEASTTISTPTPRPTVDESSRSNGPPSTIVTPTAIPFEGLASNDSVVGATRHCINVPTAAPNADTKNTTTTLSPPPPVKASWSPFPPPPPTTTTRKASWSPFPPPTRSVISTPSPNSKAHIIPRSTSSPSVLFAPLNYKPPVEEDVRPVVGRRPSVSSPSTSFAFIPVLATPTKPVDIPQQAESNEPPPYCASSPPVGSVAWVGSV